MKELAEMFKALGDPIRLEIVRSLMGKELCVCDIHDAFQVSQPTISHHLKVLKYAGLVTDSREGKWIYYSLTPEAFSRLGSFLTEVQTDITSPKRAHTCE
jgi:ArsR family transcriptional regulator